MKTHKGIKKTYKGIRTTVYIREEDVEKWQAIEWKSKWVADMLNGNESDLDRRVRRIVKEELANVQSQYN
jgi:hypothetical protein